MAITAAGNTIQLTATNAATALWPDLREIVGMSFEGTGLTTGQELVVRAGATIGSGDVLADYITEGTTDQRDLDRKSTRLNSSHVSESRMPSSA